MNIKEFNAWLSRNVGSGGKRPSLDAFNKHLKGQERNPTAAEYPIKDIPEYPHYPASKDLRKDSEDKKREEQSKKDQSKKSQSSASSQGAGRVASSVVRNVVPRVVLVTAGSVVVVGAYNEMEERKELQTVTSVSWSWGEDNLTATLNCWNKEDELIKEVLAEVTGTEVTSPTCTVKGLMSYTATAKNGGESYTDTRDVDLPALGHALDDGTETLIDGKPSMVYECSRCHEEFVVTISSEVVDLSVPKYLARWDWAEDHLSCNVELIDRFGHLIKQGEAEISVVVEEPTCTTDGATVYTASFIEGEDTYSDECSVSIGALGHALDDGTETLIDGKPSMVYECSRCHEEFVVSIVITEGDGEQAAIYLPDASRLEELGDHHDACHHHHHI